VWKEPPLYVPNGLRTWGPCVIVPASVVSSEYGISSIALWAMGVNVGEGATAAPRACGTSSRGRTGRLNFV
jgi:hypothetical protein